MNEEKKVLILAIDEAEHIIKRAWKKSRRDPNLRRGMWRFARELFWVILGLTLGLVWGLPAELATRLYQKIKTGL